jgi:hypothetical protein
MLGIRDVLVLLKSNDAAGLMAHLAGPVAEEDKGKAEEKRESIAAVAPSRDEDEVEPMVTTRRAFVVCARTWDDFGLLDGSFGSLSSAQMQTLATKLSALLVPWSCVHQMIMQDEEVLQADASPQRTPS